MNCVKGSAVEPPKRCYTGAIWFAVGVLRPWVMTDVFAIALALFLVSMQDEKYMVTQIPAGKFPWPNWLPGGGSEQFIRVEFLSGLYLLLGAGTAVFLLRWYWSTQMPEPDLE